MDASGPVPGLFALWISAPLAVARMAARNRRRDRRRTACGNCRARTLGSIILFACHFEPRRRRRTSQNEKDITKRQNDDFTCAQCETASFCLARPRAAV